MRKLVDDKEDKNLPRIPNLQRFQRFQRIQDPKPVLATKKTNHTKKDLVLTSKKN
jgi:hypothetical protein